jgi:hypothetical protein
MSTKRASTQRSRPYLARGNHHTLSASEARSESDTLTVRDVTGNVSSLSLYDRIKNDFSVVRGKKFQFVRINGGETKRSTLVGRPSGWSTMFTLDGIRDNRLCDRDRTLTETSLELCFPDDVTIEIAENALKNIVDYISLSKTINALKISNLRRNLSRLLDPIASRLAVLVLHDCDGFGDLKLSKFGSLVHLSIFSSDKLRISKCVPSALKEMFVSADINLEVDEDVIPFLDSLRVTSTGRDEIYLIPDSVRKIVHTENCVQLYSPLKKTIY